MNAPHFARCLLACLALLALQVSTRADSLDRELLPHARMIVKHLRAAGYHDVGILRFRTKLPGHKEATFVSGPLNANLAERLEVALVLSIAPEDDLRILHEAGNIVAAKGQKLSYLRAADREKMFALKYPVAWGSASVQPDAFLTGYVELKKVKGKKKLAAEATVIVLGRGKKPVELPSFPLRVTSAFAAEAGIAQRRGAALADFDEPIDSKEEPMKTEDKEPAKVDEPTKKTEEKEPVKVEEPVKKTEEPLDLPKGPFIEFFVQYGEGEKFTPRLHPSKEGWEKIPEPKTGGLSVTCWVKNVTDSPVAMVLKMNGMNTLGYEKSQAENCKMWTLRPGEQYAVWAYNVDGDKFDPFKTVSDEDWEALSTTVPAPGQIELAVFVPKTKVALKPPPVTEPNTTSEAEMKISQRAILGALDAPTRRKMSLAQLKTVLASKNLGEFKRAIAGNKLTVRGGIIHDPKAQFDYVLERTTFPDAMKVEHRFIEYWAAPSK